MKTIDQKRTAISRKRTRRGLSLVEVLAVVAILGVLAVMVLPRIMANSDETNKNACYLHIGNIEVQVQQFFRDNAAWPQDNLSDMVPPGTTGYFPEGLPVCPMTGSAYTIDPTTHEVVGHDHG